MNQRAIAIGAGVGVGGTLLIALLHAVLPIQLDQDTLPIYLTLTYLIGGAIDIATGAVAGTLARMRGALHGFVAGAIATLASILIGYGMTLWVMRGVDAPTIEFWRYVLQLLPQNLVGLGLAAAAGAIAARIAAKRAAAP